MKLSLLPNLITLARIALVPVLILLLHAQEYGQALLVFLIAGISDGLDGFIAKRWHYVTRLGAILDPLADKLLLVSSYVMLALVDQLPFWLVLAVVSRDALIIGGYLVYTSLYGPVHMRPSVFSKLNTLLQISLIVAVLANQAFALTLPQIVAAMTWIVLATTVGSGAHYLWIWGVRREIESDRPGHSHE